MATPSLDFLLQEIRRFSGSQSEQESDRQLLGLFRESRDEAAFTALVRRHGSMVFGVCRRVLHQEQDAEDALQATFLVLSRKAASLRPTRSVGGWLHKVAYHLALRVRENAARRRRNEKEVRPMTLSEDPTSEVCRHELRSVLDEELRQLPAKYREPLILCYLEGKTNEQAASQLGWRAGSMARRLTRGRELLRRRLVRRGVTLSISAMTTALMEESASAAVPPLLATSVVRMALQTSAASVPASVTGLAAEGIRELFLVKLRLALLVTLTVIGVGVGVLACQSRAEHPTEKNSGPPPQANEHAELSRTDLYGDPLPSGALMRLGTVRMRDRHMSVVFSQDGQTVISAGLDMIIRTWDATTGKEIRRTSLEATKPLLNGLRLSEDGKTVEGYTTPEDQTLYVWDAVTGKRKLSIPMGHNIPATALSIDGKVLAAELRSEKTQLIHLWDATSGKERYRLKYPQHVDSLAFSTDLRVLGAVGRDEKLRIWDATTGNEIRTIHGAVRELALSPDGKSAARTTRQAKEALQRLERRVTGQASR